MSERREEKFTQEEFDLIPNMSTPVKRDGNDATHPHWVNIQIVRSPRSPRFSLYALEDGELLEYDSEENWDEEEGKQRRRLKPRPLVSNTNQSVKPKTNKRDETNEISKVNVEALIEKKVSERVDSFLKEHSRLNESLNSQLNISDKIQVEVIEKYSGINRVYKLTAASKFEMFEDYLISELKTKKLEYVIRDEQTTNVSEDKLTNDKHKVRDIIINHIDEKYYV